MEALNDISSEPVPWEALDEIVNTGGFADMTSDEAMSLISDAVSRPTYGGVALDTGMFNVREVEDYLLSAYVDATAAQLDAEARACADAARADAYAEIVPAMCRASGVGPETYFEARALRDAGNASPLLDMYSAFLGDL